MKSKIINKLKMKKLLLILLSVFFVTSGYSQTDKIWSPYRGTVKDINIAKAATRASFPKDFSLYNLNIDALGQVLY